MFKSHSGCELRARYVANKNGKPECDDREAAQALGDAAKPMPIRRPSIMPPDDMMNIAIPIAVGIVTMLASRNAGETPAAIASKLVPIAVAIST